jgi:hypothetical protein
MSSAIFSISRPHTAQTRSISAKNPTGAKGGGTQATEGISAVAARALGKGWKVSLAIALPAGDTATLASVDGPGVIWRFVALLLGLPRRSEHRSTLW